MMDIDTSSPVMVNGATGYIGGVLVKALLEEGLTVHCAVRDPSTQSKIQHLIDVQKVVNKGQLRFFKADLLTKDSYLEAMKGCQVVFHVASPYAVNVDPTQVDQLLMEPAVQGTRNVLASVAKTPSVKRVVLTSSIYAMITDAADTYDIPPNNNGAAVTEASWNQTASKTYNPYAYSKTVAEREAWNMANRQSQYQLVVVNPAWVFGPGLKVHRQCECHLFLKKIGDGSFYVAGAPKMGCPVVDVRDVATCHVKAAFVPQAKGRYICMSENTTVFDYAQTIVRDPRFASPPHHFPLPTTSTPKLLLWLIAPYVGLTRRQVWRGVNWQFNMDNTKSIQDLGMTYRPIEETFPAMFQQMVDDGMIPTPLLKK